MVVLTTQSDDVFHEAEELLRLFLGMTAVRAQEQESGSVDYRITIDTHYEQGRWYAEARRLGELVTREADALGEPVIVATGGGPGIMEAGNRGAFDAGGRSMGMSIFLPFEEAPNPYITPELCFQFHYFAIRKMHFLMRAVALVSFPGGLGTLDELFEVLTLTQTRKIRRRPIVLIGRDFWQRLIDFDVLVEHGVISPEDKNLFHYAETAEEAWDAIKAAYSGDNPALTARQLKGN